MLRVFFCVLILLLAVSARAEEPSSPAASPDVSAVTPEQAVFFESKIRPVLVEHCYRCHSGEKQKGNLHLDSRNGILAGGDSGPAIVPGKPEESVLIQAINYDGYEMPPGGKLPAGKIAVLTKWVAMGAPWPGASGEPIAPVRKGNDLTEEDRAWWSFQPIQTPSIPRTSGDFLPDNPIDAFILARLREKSLTPNPPASAPVLIRRAYFDLIGLPPSPEEMQQWTARLQPGKSQADAGVNQAAWARLIDELLARPQYGERWGRHWLDVVRFAQTNGYERDDEKKFAWRYRDYVIQSFNADKPYDRFVLEQLAGDELPDADDDDDSKIATGFYRLGLWDDEPDDALQAEFDDLDEIVVASSAAFLGLTMGCARCHDHKFDPISHRDYYSLAAFFRNVRRFSKPELCPENSGFLPIGKPDVFQKAMQAREKRWKELDAKIAAAESKEEKKQLEQQRHNKTLPGIDWTLAVRETGTTPPDTHILIRGNSQTPGDKVQPAFPQVFGAPFPEVTPPHREAPFETSGRRLALARWLVAPEHPLTARVMANRIWHYHFGRGIVSTTSDFGKVGTLPTHPKLLDWLAREFMNSGWSVKQMHRRIMLSRTWQRSSSRQTNPAADQVDPDNFLLWRQNLHRLDAESIRDSLLAISGSLNQEAGGRGYFPRVGAEVLSGGTVPGIGWELSSESQRHRRSVYTFIKRSLVSPQLDTFDYANTALPFTERPTTTVAPQALALLNDPFVNDLADLFAVRVQREAGSDISSQVRRAFQIALNRNPTPDEQLLAMAYLQQQQSQLEKIESRLVFRPLVPVSLHPSYLNVLPATEFVAGPSSGWTPQRGEWSKTGSLNVQRGPISLWEGAVFEDARLTTRLMLGNAAELAGLFLRASKTGDFVQGYEILLDARQGTFALVRHRGERNVLVSKEVILPTEVPLRLSASVQGQRLVAELRLPGKPGKTVSLEFTDPDPIIPPGHLGARTWGASLMLDDLHLNMGEKELDVARLDVSPGSAELDNPVWNRDESRWRADAAGVIAPEKPTAGGKVVWLESEFSDGTLEADVRVQGEGDAGLIVRVQDPQPGVDTLTAYNINVSKSRLRLGKHERNWQELVAVPRQFPADRWVHLRVELNGPRIRIFVDQEVEPAIDFTDPRPLAAGMIGLRTFRCPVQIQHLAYTGSGERQQLHLANFLSKSTARIFVAGPRPNQSAERALASFCQLLMNLNETMYVE